jgi:hypothetical protein
MSYGYDGIVDGWGYEVVLSDGDNDYQGDNRWLLRDGGRYGILVYGFGSCSGCDAFQAAEDEGPAAVEALGEDMKARIIWGESKKDALEKVLGRDWLTHPDWREEPAMFVRDVALALGAGDVLTSYVRALLAADTHPGVLADAVDDAGFPHVAVRLQEPGVCDSVVKTLRRVLDASEPAGIDHES